MKLLTVSIIKRPKDYYKLLCRLEWEQDVTLVYRKWYRSETQSVTNGLL